MAQPLSAYDPELLITACATLHALPHSRLRATTILDALCFSYRAVPVPPHDLAGFTGDLVAAYEGSSTSTSTSSRTGSAGHAPRRQKPEDRQYERTRLLSIVERALADRRREEEEVRTNLEQAVVWASREEAGGG